MSSYTNSLLLDLTIDYHGSSKIDNKLQHRHPLVCWKLCLHFVDAITETVKKKCLQICKSMRNSVL